MAARFPTDIRQAAAKRFRDGSAAKEVCDWVERQCGRRPSPLTVRKWNDDIRRGIVIAEVSQTNPPETVARAVALRMSSEWTLRAIEAECSVRAGSILKWVDRFGPDPADAASMTFEQVYEATMDAVRKQRRTKRDKQAQRSNAPKPVPRPVGPVDEWIPGPGPVPDKDHLPDDPEALKRLLRQELDRNEVKNAVIQALMDTGEAGTAGKGLVHDGKTAAAVQAAAVNALVDATGISTAKACRRVGMPESTYYYQRRRAVSATQRAARRDELKVLITQAVEETGRSYGYRRIHHWLRCAGHTVSEKIVRACMTELGLHPPARTFSKYSSYTGETAHRPDNLLLVTADTADRARKVAVSGYFTSNADRLGLTHDFHADAPWEKIGTDVTEIACADGRLYVSAAIDFYDGMPVAVTMSESPNHDLVAEMISAIEAQKPAGARPIIHSDRGGLYRSTKWVEMITDPAHDTNACPQCTPDGRCAQSWRYIPSLSRRGNSGDNARVEGFFGTMKQERLIGRPQTKQMTKAEMIDYINDYIDFYIHKRFKSTLGAGYTTIAQHRQLLSA